MHYNFSSGKREFEIDTKPHGDARFLVYMRELRAPSRPARACIGYLNGAGRNWTAEFFGKKPPAQTRTAKAACLALAEWALTQPAFREQQAA